MLPAPADVYFSASTVVEQDVVFVAGHRVADLTDERFLDIPPDLVVEVSSPSTRRLDLVRKRALYEREGVREYWFVDLDAGQVDMHRLDDTGRYGDPPTVGRDGVLTCPATPGLQVAVADLTR